MTTDFECNERHITESSIVQTADDAADAACAVLDRAFPGYEAGGITSNFQGLLVEAIKKMLTGVDPVRKSTTTHLNRLVLDDHHFGQPLIRGEMFMVRKPDGTDWDISGAKPKHTPKHLYLDSDNRAFVKITNGERLDPFTSFESAVQGAIQWLNAYGTTQAEAKLEVVPVAYAGESGYVVNPHQNAA